jgi:hypothetical protein
LEFLKVLLVRQQIFLPISKGGIGFISIEIIALTTYLGSLGLITLIITSMFLQYDRPFSLGVIRLVVEVRVPVEE